MSRERRVSEDQKGSSLGGDERGSKGRHAKLAQAQWIKTGDRRVVEKKKRSRKSNVKEERTLNLAACPYREYGRPEMLEFSGFFWEL